MPCLIHHGTKRIVVFYHRCAFWLSLQESDLRRFLSTSTTREHLELLISALDPAKGDQLPSVVKVRDSDNEAALRLSMHVFPARSVVMNPGDTHAK